MKISNEIALDFDDVLLVPQRSKTPSRRDVNVERTFHFYHSPRKWTGVPIMIANMDTCGTFTMAKAAMKHKIITCLHKHYTVKELVDFYKALSPVEHDFVWYSMGIKADDFLKLRQFCSEINIQPNICIDVANGYTEDFVKFCKTIRNDCKQSIIMSGNIATPEMVQELILHGGVDIAKIGIGPGSACTTRLKTGVGVPQLSAIINCSHAAHGLKSDEKRLGLICGDGGLKESGDFAKGFSANADFLMAGGIFAGTDECEGEWEYDLSDGNYTWVDNKPFKQDEQYNPVLAPKKNMVFYGMSSKKAQEKHGEGLKEYRSSEGRVLKIPYKGKVDNVIQDILGGIRSSASYIGATCIKDMSKCAEFIRVNRVHYDRSIE